MSVETNLKDLLEKIDIASKLAENVDEALKSTILITCLAHEKGMELNKVADPVFMHMHEFLHGYEDVYGESPLVEVEPFFRRLIIECRNETEFRLGVIRERRETS